NIDKVRGFGLPAGLDGTGADAFAALVAAHRHEWELLARGFGDGLSVIRTSIVENGDREVLDRNNQRPIDALDRGQKRARLVVSDHDDGQSSIAGNHPTSLPCRSVPSLANSSLVSNSP